VVVDKVVLDDGRHGDGCGSVLLVGRAKLGRPMTRKLSERVHFCRDPDDSVVASSRCSCDRSEFALGALATISAQIVPGSALPRETQQ